jgi:hypothetical protein
MKKFLLLSIVSFAFSAVFFSCSKDEEIIEHINYNVNQSRYNISANDTLIQIVTDAPIAVLFVRVYEAGSLKTDVVWNSPKENTEVPIAETRDTLAVNNVTVLRLQKNPSIFKVSIGANTGGMRYCIVTMGGDRYYTKEVEITQREK